MQKTWLETFHEQTNLNQYPIALRTRGGIGYKMPGGETVSTFVGHPVHYLENGIYKPITLKPHSNGDFEGSDFSWRGKQVFYKGKTLFEPRAVIFNGVKHNLFLRQDGNRIVADLNFEGSSAQYEVIFNEKGVKELLTIFEPVEGLVEFDVPHTNKPDGLYKKDRHIIGGITAETFQLTADMKYPLVIDPDYAGVTGGGQIQGFSATYSTARSTSTSSDIAGTTMSIAHQLAAGDYYCLRAYPKFDTSGIGTDTVTQANMSLFVNDYAVSTHFNVLIMKQNWSASDPIGAGNRETVFDDTLTATQDDNIWKNSADVAAGFRYASGNLATAWVNKTGYTYYALINSLMYANTAPTANDQIITFCTQDHGTSGNRPHLTVTHAPAASARNSMTLLGVG